MKIHKTITIDFELWEKLRKEANASAIINKLVFEYYNGRRGDVKKLRDMITEQKLKEIDEEMKEFEDGD